MATYVSTIHADENIEIKPNVMANIVSAEEVTITTEEVGIMGLRKSIASNGLMIGSNMVLPGYKGKLTIQIFNASDKIIEIRKGDELLNFVILR